MTNDRHHPDQDRIQAYIDGRLPDPERAAMRAHLDRCRSCAAEAGAWRELFASLEELPELSPSAGFADRVLDRVTGTEGLAARLRSWLDAIVRPWAGAPGHLESRLALEYVDGALSAARRARVEHHLEGCAACREEVAAWRSLVAGLEGLERPAPSPAFADAVMERVHVTDRSAAPARDRQAVGWLERLGPRTRIGRAAAAAALLAPAAAMIGAAAALFSHPLLTPAHLAAFVWWQISGAAGELLTSAGGAAMESGVLLWLGELGRDLVASPLVAGSAMVAFAAAMLAALWILYRNLVSTRPRSRSYANGTA